MSFTYLVPLPRLHGLLVQVDPRLHSEFVDRLRVEIHADLTRKMKTPGTFKRPTGALSDSIQSWVGGQGIVLYSDLDYAKFIEEGTKPGRPKLTFGGKTVNIPGVGFRRITWKSMMEGKWFYPGMAGKGLFRNAVSEVLARAGTLVREFDKKAMELS